MTTRSPKALIALTAIAAASCSAADHTPGNSATRSTTAASPPASPWQRPATPTAGTPTPQHRPPHLPAVDHHDPTAVSKAALTLMWSVDSARDHNGQADAVRRAEPYLTPGCAALLREASAPPPKPWVRHRAYGLVNLLRGTESGAPADTGTAAYRQWRITVTPTGRDGWRGTPSTVTAYLTLQRPTPGAPWKISQVHIT